MNSTRANSTAALLVAELVLRGIQAQVRDDQLWLCPPARVTRTLRKRLCEQKVAVIDLLQEAGPDANECEAWEERVAICMFDGALSEEDAEIIAWTQIEEGRAEDGYEHRRPEEVTL